MRVFRLHVRLKGGPADPTRAFADARGWATTEYNDHGISGARTCRPALDALLAAARARRLDVVVTTKLDRLAVPHAT
jgi:DNA invertase Pin-like site-specific DNA recombinase